MYKETIETKIIQTIGIYTIIKSIEQLYFDSGKRFDKANVWYDVCLDNGNGDIVSSHKKLNDAKKWAKEN